MARKPFFGSGPAPQIARMDMQSATAPGRMYFNALTQFGQSLAGGIEKFAKNKEKKENQANMENMLVANGMDADLAKPLSKDPQAFGNYMALQKFGLQKDAGERAQQSVDLENERVHIAKNNDVRAEKTFNNTQEDREKLNDQKEAQEEITKNFMLSPGAEAKYGKEFTSLYKGREDIDFTTLYKFAEETKPKAGILSRFTEAYDGPITDLASDKPKVRKKALLAFLNENPDENDLKLFDGLREFAKTNKNSVSVTEIPGYDAGVVAYGDNKSQVIYKGGNKGSSAFTTNIKAMSDYYKRAKAGDTEALREFKLGLVEKMRMGKTDPQNPLTDQYSINPVLMDMAEDLGIGPDELIGN